MDTSFNTINKMNIHLTPQSQVTDNKMNNHLTPQITDNKINNHLTPQLKSLIIK